MIEKIDIKGTAAGMAALSICESLLLAMGDLKIMGEADAVGIISDAADAHREVGASSTDKALNLEVVAILERIIAGGNSVRRP
ncbi:MAG: hypothetical protein ABL893_08925 [Hyphomicrobium sp.]|nr:hypothetical protein [Hyphomicrobium sp.]